MWHSTVDTMRKYRAFPMAAARVWDALRRLPEQLLHRSGDK